MRSVHWEPLQPLLRTGLRTANPLDGAASKAEGD